MTLIRQGDVLIRSVQQRPNRLTPIAARAGRLILAEGEATGHHHSIRFADNVALFREDGSGSGLFLSIGPGAPVILEHQEHTPHALAPGGYRVTIQRTYAAGVARRVED